MFNLSTLTDLVSDAADNLIEIAGSEPGRIVSKVFGPAGSAVSTIASTYTRSTEGEQQERTRAQMYSIGPTLSTVRESGGTLDAHSIPQPLKALFQLLTSFLLLVVSCLILWAVLFSVAGALLLLGASLGVYWEAA